MKKLFVFLAGMCFYLQFTNVQAQFMRHYWLNTESVNYTLSTQDANTGDWMLAAARNGENVTTKNTIAVFRLDAAYNIRHDRVIGLPGSGSHGFDSTVTFEVHCITKAFGLPDS